MTRRQRQDIGATDAGLSEERFAREYLLDLNATRAYLRVFPDVKPDSARTLGARMFAKVHIKARITELQTEMHKALEERNKINAQWIENRLVENIGRAMQATPVLDSEGNPTGLYTYHGSVANKALETLARIRGLMSEKVNHAGVVEHIVRYTRE